MSPSDLKAKIGEDAQGRGVGVWGVGDVLRTLVLL